MHAPKRESQVPVPRDQVYVVEGSEAQGAAQEYNTRINYLPPSVPRHGDFPVLDFVVLDVAAGNGSVAGLMPNRPVRTHHTRTHRGEFRSVRLLRHVALH